MMKTYGDISGSSNYTTVDEDSESKVAKAIQRGNEPDKQPRGKFLGIMKMLPAWLLAGYRQCKP